MKTTRLLSFVMVLVMALTVFTACELFPVNPDLPDGPRGSVKVVWRQGQKVLKEEQVESGTTLEDWTPVVEGKQFIGWYSDPGCTTPFDFEQAITEDTTVYASFKSNGNVDIGDDEPVVPDFYLVGTGLGDLSKSGWDHNKSAANLGMTGLGAGVYTITISMYAGDMFQICHNLSWDGQVGLGYVQGAAALEDNPNAGQVLDADGNVVFTGTIEYSNPIDKWNITLAEGQDGKYEFTYDSVSGVVTWKLIERLDPDDIPANPDDEPNPDATIPVTLYFKNTAGWSKVNLYSWITVGDVTTNFAGAWPGRAMTKVEGTEDWYSIEIMVSATEGLNIIFNGTGGQTSDLTYDADKIYWVYETPYATQEEADENAAPIVYDWYLRGSMNEWGTVDALVRAEDGSASITVTLEVGDEFKVATEGWNPQFDFYSLADATGFEAGEGGNIKVVTAGEYVVTVTADNTLVITPVN